MKKGIQNFVNGHSSKSSKSLKILTVLIVVGMLFFCTSNIYLPTSNNIKLTPLGTSVSASSSVYINFQAVSYNPKTKYMEVVFSIDAPISFSRPKFGVSTVSSKSANKKLDCFVAFQGLTTCVVGMQNIPKNYDVISLHLLYDDKDINFKFDDSMVSLDENLNQKTQEEYQLISVNNEIEATQNAILNCDQTVQENTKKIESLISEIKQLENQKQYQTDEEIQTTNSAITGKQKEIINLQDDISKQQNQTEKLKVKREKLTQIKNQGGISPP